MKKLVLILSILLALLTFGQATWAQNLIINSVDDWNTFAQSVTNGSTYTGQTVQLNTDITVSTMAGVENKCFAGTFDGKGHTITLDMTASMQFTSLFCYADGAIFQNLKVDGIINTTKKFCAGFVGGVINHGCTFTNCVSDVTINSSISGDGTHGGLVAYVGKGDNTFEGCAFTGKLLGANTNYVGGLVGFTDSRNGATVSFTNCVFHPQQVTMSGNGSQTFARWYGNNSGSVTIGDNCYYSQTLGAAQGKQMRSITGGDYVTVAFSGNATTYKRSGISAYSVGIVYGSTLYAGNGETVSLNLSCTPPSGYVCSGYTTNNGTLTGTANPYTLTMSDEPVMIQAVLEQLLPVAYIDENGEEQECASYTLVTNNLGFDNLSAGWYVVKNDIYINSSINFTGDVHLILCDNATLNISCLDDALVVDGSLTLYVQSEGTGSLTANSNGGNGIVVFENLTINGGTVTTNEIFSPIVTLGWSNTNNCITVGSFAHYYTPTVSVKSGQAFYYIGNDSGEKQVMDTVVISGTLTSEEISAIGGKTLRPYIEPCAAPFNLEVTDIGTTSATLYWMGWTEQYEVMYEAVGENVTREVSTGNNHSIVITDLTPNTTYEWKVRGVDCDGNGGNTEWSEMSFFTTPPISCYPVDLLSYDNLTSFSVNLSWVLEDETQTAWQICLNGDESNLIAANTNEGFLLDNLTPDVEYTVKVRAYCDENDYSSWSSTITFTTPEVCFTPRNLAANNITAVSTDLSWTGREDVESYTVRYRTIAERTGEWITETTSETEAQLTDLDGGTTYEAQVRSDCNPDGWCNMITFTTLDENTKVFVFEGEWSDGDNWVPVGVPTIDNDVVLRAEATVFDVAEANVITIDDAGALIIEDGGQLKTNADVEATMKKFVIGYGIDYVETDNGYYLIAIPTTDSISAADASLLTADNNYDLYGWVAQLQE